MKLLNGREIADYIKERQIRQVRNLRQAWGVAPKLAIVQTGQNPASDVYVRMKRSYGEDMLIDVDVHHVGSEEARSLVEQLNVDPLVHGIVVQLPLEDASHTDEVLRAIAPEKDVDGLGPDAAYISATATAIDWLLAGYNVTLKDRPLAIVGNGRLVGAPLFKLWQSSGYDVSVYDDATSDLKSAVRGAHVVVTATGQPGLITEDMLQLGAVVVDAGTATDGNSIVGDVAPSVRERQDLTITPEKGGVGPLTIAALFDNVITAARKVAEQQQD